MNSLLVVTFAILAIFALDKSIAAPSPSLKSDLKVNGHFLESDLTHLIAKFSSDVLIQRLFKNQDPRAPVLPEFEDPYNFNATQFNFTDLGENYEGQFSHGGGQVLGLSTLVDNLVVYPLIPARAIFTLSAAQIVLGSGEYSLDLLFNNTASFTGTGNLEGSISGVNVRAEVRLLVNLITSKVSVTYVSLDLGFESVRVRAEAFEYNDQLIDWEWFDENGAVLFDAIYEGVRPTVEAELKVLLNDALRECTIGDLVGGNFECITLPGPAP